MDRDSKNIFKNYRILLEQQSGPSVADLNQRVNAVQQVGQKSAIDMENIAVITDIIVKSINAAPDVDPIVKQASIQYVSQPAFGEGLIKTIQTYTGSTPQQPSQPVPSEADLNDKAGADQAAEN